NRTRESDRVTGIRIIRGVEEGVGHAGEVFLGIIPIRGGSARARIDLFGDREGLPEAVVRLDRAGEDYVIRVGDGSCRRAVGHVVDVSSGVAHQVLPVLIEHSWPGDVAKPAV